MRQFSRGLRLLICAAGRGMLVCGYLPGHSGPHHDIEWPITWQDPS